MTSVPNTTTTAVTITAIAGIYLLGNRRNLRSLIFCSSIVIEKRVQNPMFGVSFGFEANNAFSRLNSSTDCRADISIAKNDSTFCVSCSDSAPSTYCDNKASNFRLLIFFILAPHP